MNGSSTLKVTAVPLLTNHQGQLLQRNKERQQQMIWTYRLTPDSSTWCDGPGLSLALVHKHAKMSVGKWIVETTRPHKHVHIFGTKFFSPCFAEHDHFPVTFYSKLLNILDFTVNSSSWCRYTLYFVYGRCIYIKMFYI